ncbi:MAG TPA: Crp/Fnr family transcriptional regulator [Allosphingosinicella sp.]|jgi:CRP-like cAMP-binding protein
MFGGNQLLEAVEASVQARFAAKVQRIELKRDEVLYSQGSDLERVYFPTSGLIGIQAETADGETVESSIVGREGAIGAFEACGSRKFFAEAVVQIPGSAARMSASVYRDLFEQSPALRTAVHRYVEQLMSETRQYVVCNSLHPVEARLARILLESIDKSGLDHTLPLTQNALGRMLGAQRTTVALIISRMQRQGVLSGRRGTLTIEDRSALEAIACSCREALQFTRRAIHAAREPTCEEVIAA